MLMIPLVRCDRNHLTRNDPESIVTEGKIEMAKTKRNIILVASIVLMLISCIFASMIQTNFGKVEVKEINWVTHNGYTMNAWLFIPENATAETPAPAVVTSHGMFNNKSMQDLNFVELARRGFVVLAQDMPSHGDSDDVDGFAATFMGLYESVKELAEMPFVDSTRIGITGHSLGGMSSNTAVTLDNAYGANLVRAVLLNCADGEYVDGEGNFTNIYGDRHMGIVAAQYDEWFFDDTDANGNPTLPREFINNKNAQSILYFGEDPAGKELRAANTIYTNENGAIRVIYTPAIIHPWSHFSYRSTVGTIEFFDAALTAPISIAPTNQIWQWKVVFNTIGLIGFFMFMVSLPLVLVKKPFFAELAVEEPVAPRATNKTGAIWFAASLVLGVAFATLTYFPILTKLNSASGYLSGPGLVQTSPRGVSAWACACGVFTILSMVVSYLFYGKKNGMALADVGVKISMKKLAKTLILAVVVLAATVSTVFLADYFFKADFRIWVLAVRAFKVEQMGLTFAPYAFLFLVYYVANSVAVNCFNYNTIGKKWQNIAILALSAVLPAIILLLMQYIPYFSGSDLMWPHNNMYGVWLFPMLVILPGAAIVSRIIYKHTKNPYIGGIICGVIVAITSCTNTLTYLA